MNQLFMYDAVWYVAGWVTVSIILLVLGYARIEYIQTENPYEESLVWIVAVTWPFAFPGFLGIWVIMLPIRFGRLLGRCWRLRNRHEIHPK